MVHSSGPCVRVAARAPCPAPVRRFFCTFITGLRMAQHKGPGQEERETVKTAAWSGEAPRCRYLDSMVSFLERRLPLALLLLRSILLVAAVLALLLWWEDL